jgi:dTDP-4-dehydrorhamnose reductase
VPRLIELLLSHNAPAGIYHAAGPDRLSRFDMGFRLAEAYGLPSDSIVAAEVERPVGLGAVDDCSLAVDKTEGLGMKFTGVTRGLGKTGKITN